MKKWLLLMLSILPACVMAQEMEKSISNQHPKSLQIEAGTQGLGADLRYGIFKRLSARLGASFVPVNTSSNLNISGFTTDYTANVKLFNAHLLADFVPFAGARGIRLVGGAAYLYKANGGVTLIPNGNYVFGNYNLSGTDIGVLNMDVSWKGVAPYFGLGLFKSFPNHFFNFNLDLGTYYLTAPSTHITGTNLLVHNDDLEPQFNDNLKGYRWLPVLQLNFNFKIK